MYTCPSCKREYSEALGYAIHREIHTWTNEPEDDPAPWVDQDGDRWSTAKKDGYLSHGPSTFTFTYSPR